MTPAEFDPERVWRFLTRCKWAAVLFATFAAGAWVGAGFIPPDYVSEREVASYRDSATKVVRHFESLEDTPYEQSIREGYIEDLVFDQVEDARWRRRRAVQNPIGVVLLVSVFLAVVCHAIRNDPNLIDGTLRHLPKVISHRIPYLLGRWRLEVRDCDGELVLTEWYRTGRAAIRSWSQSYQECKCSIVWDMEARHAYWDFMDRRAKERMDKAAQRSWR